jgi:hypothetical protein
VPARRDLLTTGNTAESPKAAIPPNRRAEGTALTITREIVIVSGLPRSGTSLMCQMLDNGGIPVLTDGIRVPDTDNPRGYYELEKVKKIKEDATWLPEARGKAFKMVSQLLYHLSDTEEYRILFMRRDLDEMLASQERMLERLGRPAGPREPIRRDFAVHLDRLMGWLAGRPHLAVLEVDYKALVERPAEMAERVNEFLGRRADVARMVASVDPSLYRNRQSCVAG